MRFGKKFQRRVGGSGTTPVLGTDSAPTGKPNETGVEPNQFSFKGNDLNGFPIQRIAVGYACTGAGSSLAATLYVYDDESDAWYIVSSNTLQLGRITFFDIPVMAGTVQNSAGGPNLCLKVDAAGGDATGTYTFAVGADLSSDVGVPTDTSGNLKTAEQFVVGWNFNHIVSATTTVVKAAPGVLHSIVVNKLVAAAVITIYDNTAASGTVIGVITLPAAGAGDMPQTVPFDVNCLAGITVVTDQAVDLTVTYL